MAKVKIYKKTHECKKFPESVSNSDQRASQIQKTQRKSKLKTVRIGTTIKIPTNNEEDNYEIREPTAKELEESEKSHNIFKLKSGRTKKKEKYAQELVNKKLHGDLKDTIRNKEYLTKWKENQSEWKFEKLRQISIQLSMFAEDKISDKLWPIALEYLSSSKGQSKNKIIELAEQEITKLDLKNEEMENHDLINNIRYQRAREILQSFQ